MERDQHEQHHHDVPADEHLGEQLNWGSSNVGANRHINGAGNPDRRGRVRLATAIVQVVLLAGFPASGFWAEVYTDWQLTETWANLYIYGIVWPAMVGTGIMTAREVAELWRAKAGVFEPPPDEPT